jgi:tetratricopeptide (TPR) repeat protein
MPAFYTRLIVLVLIIFFLATIPAIAANNRSASQQIAGRADYPLLTGEQPVERELKAGEVHRYRIKISTNQYLHVSAEQRGIDIGLRLSTPAGDDFDEVDSYNSKKDGESFITVLSEEGEYLLTVRSVDGKANPGKYLLKIDELRAATQQDSYMLEARQAYADGDLLYSQKSVTQFKNAAKKYDEALSLYRLAGDIKGEANSLRGLGNVYTTLNEPQKALPFYEQSLPLWEKLNDKYGRASTLLGIGDIYSALNEQEKALGFYEQSLPIWVDKADKYGIAYTLNNIGMIYRVIGDYERSLGFFREAITPYQDIGNLVGEANTHDNIGGAYFSMEDYDGAFYHYEQSLMLYRL